MENSLFYNKLQELDIVSEISHFQPEVDVYGYQFYQVKFVQPIDHKNPSAGTFKQRAYVFFVNSDSPTVLHTCGYGLPANPIQHMGIGLSMYANVIMVEHRYYGESTVENDSRWDYLTIEQAAADHHAIYQALKPILPKGWVSTGLSKDGETAVFYRYLYPNDIDVTVTFCAPFLTSLHDHSIGNYLQNECGTKAEHEMMVAHMRRMLEGGENGIYKQFKEMMEKTNPGLDASFTHYVHFCFEYFFTYYQYRFCSMPAMGSSADMLFNVIMNDAKTGNYIEIMPEFYPWFVQLAKQLGRYEHDFDAYADLLEGTSFDKEKAVECLTPLKDEDKWLYSTYDNSIIKNIREQFLPTTELPFLFVYSKNDPWSGARITKVNEQHSKIIINEKGTHSDYILLPNYYAPEIKQEILDFITHNLPQS